MTRIYKTPRQIQQAYESGLPGWQFDQDTDDALMADGVVQRFGEAAPHLSGAGKGKMALLWRSREKYDPGAFGQESQKLGDCVSHGDRNARDVTRCVEMHIQHQPEEYFARGATELTYRQRTGRAGMDPARATRFVTESGFAFRRQYDWADLRTYNPDFANGRGATDAMLKDIKPYHVGRWIRPESVDEAKDLLFSGYAMHSGQQFGVRTTSDSRGIAVQGSSWNHDLATVGYMDTKDIYPECVFLIANSWGRWNQRPKVWPEDALGPWPIGSFWVTEEIYGRYFVGSRSIFAYADISSVPQKNLPDWGNLGGVLG